MYIGSPIKDWCELRDKRVAIPNPVTEGIGALFRDLYNEYCGDYLEFVSKGNVYITKIHHREIPQLLSQGLIDAGVMWTTEANYWNYPHITPAKNKKGRLAFALMPWASKEARELYNQLRKDEVKRIYEKYGFKWIA